MTPSGENIESSMQASSDTEKAILTAARTCFQRNGFAGARVQEIADMAGINKALLHYYFRNKDQLFEAVFQEALMTNFQPLMAIMKSELSLEEKIPAFISGYIQTLLRNPYMPGFILHELSQQPGRLVAFLENRQIFDTTRFFDQIRQGSHAGRYRQIDPRQALAHLMALIIFPFVARPVMQLALQLSDDEFQRFLIERQTEVSTAFFSIMRNP